MALSVGEIPASSTEDFPSLPIVGVMEEGEPDFKQTSNFKNWETSKFRTEKLRSWEAKMRKQELQKQSPLESEPDYRFWELKLRKGELDPLIRKSKQTWLLDKAAKLPETFSIETNRTFWEVKTTGDHANEKRCFSMPVRERPPSLCPSNRLSLREGFEKCVRLEHDTLQDVYSSYFENEGESSDSAGRTLMVNDLRNKFSIEDVLGILDELGAEHVDYVFLPLSVWETKKKSARGPAKSKSNARNLSYCFVHFSDVAAADAFTDRLSLYEPPSEERNDGRDAPRLKKMYASLSSTQGIVENLLRLMDIHNRKWHPRAGAIALRLGDSLAPVNAAALRTFLKEILKESPTTVPACLHFSRARGAEGPGSKEMIEKMK
jgi:hypothetical protein